MITSETVTSQLPEFMLSTNLCGLQPGVPTIQKKVENFIAKAGYEVEEHGDQDRLAKSAEIKELMIRLGGFTNIETTLLCGYVKDTRA